MALNDAEHEELLSLLKETRDAAKALGDGWAAAVEKCNQFRAATVSAAETAQLAIERLQKQEALVKAALKWREEHPYVPLKWDNLHLRTLAMAADDYNKYLKERS